MIVNLAIGDEQGCAAGARGGKGLAPAGKVNDRKARLGKSGAASMGGLLSIRATVMQAGLHYLQAIWQRVSMWF